MAPRMPASAAGEGRGGEGRGGWNIIHCAGHVSTSTRPYRLYWGDHVIVDGEMATDLS